MEFMLTGVPSFWLMIAFIGVGAALIALPYFFENIGGLLSFVAVIASVYFFARYSTEFVFWPVGSALLGAAVTLYGVLSFESWKSTKSDLKSQVADSKKAIERLKIDIDFHKSTVKTLEAQVVEASQRQSSDHFNDINELKKVISEGGRVARIMDQMLVDSKKGYVDFVRYNNAMTVDAGLCLARYADLLNKITKSKKDQTHDRYGKPITNKRSKKSTKKTDVTASSGSIN